MGKYRHTVYVWGDDVYKLDRRALKEAAEANVELCTDIGVTRQSVWNWIKGATTPNDRLAVRLRERHPEVFAHVGVWA